MSSFFPWGLFRPYVSTQGTDTIWDILIPVFFLLAVAAGSSVPAFQSKGLWMAAIYMIVSFFVLCLLRVWVLVWSADLRRDGRLYISTSMLTIAELESTFFPSFLWIAVSFGMAYLIWGWKISS